MASPEQGKQALTYFCRQGNLVSIFTYPHLAQNLSMIPTYTCLSGVPSGSIFLIEDINCCFPSQEEEEEEAVHLLQSANNWDQCETEMKQPKSQVTLPALLNTIDRTNYMDQLDPALLWLGRVDHKLKYFLTSEYQASSLFWCFYPGKALANSEPTIPEKPATLSDIELLSEKCSASIPPNQFSTAELQGYLLLHKEHPVVATNGIEVWVKAQLIAHERKECESEQRKGLMVIYWIDSREHEDLGSDQSSSSRSRGEGRRAQQ
ncbi:hypothetical protein BDN71DRAFT_1429658 [Pleurotus eryngii]|uniref:Mitochondrial chaperone BCS1-like ATPase lid domain-containing protein n=1 Tax=Pleurotus eryngii TaxID=5323 RepID=A0A9P6A4Y3_PLEER|nr:hypothetical protein BDN71DRAFT_1429658 [Pleurotus eryngii]